MRLEASGAAGSAAEVEVKTSSGRAEIDGRGVEYRERRAGGRLVGVEIHGETTPVRSARDGDRAFVWCAGRVWEIRRPGTGAASARGSRSRHTSDASGLLSPMPGRIRRILVAEGDAVTRGQVLLVLEAMKMEHAIRAPRDGRVRRLAFSEGDLVDAGVPLVEIAAVPEPADAPPPPPLG